MSKNEIKKIEDLIQKAKELGFIEKQKNSRYLTVSRKGREFLSLLYFIEYTAHEFGFTASIFSAILVGLIVGVTGTFLYIG